ncbi:MAG: hypothetical protein MZV64_09815 [Ignavibacteriales bacterium]|nr:hypothetical protein [Ignavibacteriales bacterium]
MPEVLRRPALVVDVVQEPHEPPPVRILAVAQGKTPKRGFHGKGVPKEGIVLVVGPPQADGFVPVQHRSSAPSVRRGTPGRNGS